VPYYFIKNLQGDVIAIVDKDAQTVARYSYDAWGVPEVKLDSSDCQIATINPFRYRGYYYDEEIGLYYISSRYFDSQTARWLSSDHSTILTYTALPICYSLFTYCCNNPVNNIDLAGYLAFSMAVIVSAAVVGTVFNAISQIAFNYLSGKRGSKIFKGVLGAAVGGAVNSALLLVLWYVPGSNVIAGFIAGFIQSVIDALFDVLVYKTLSWRNFLKECTVNGLWNSAANIAGNYLGGKLVYIDKGWFKPKYVASFLKGSYGQRLIAQTGIGAILNLIVNLIRKLFKL
jgi:RHS repeat-associated protein